MITSTPPKKKSKNKNYIRGRNFEYKCKKLLESQGYLVFRSAGSKGVADLICIKDGLPLLVQCKTSVTNKTLNSHISKSEIDKFIYIATQFNVSALVMTPTETVEVFHAFAGNKSD